MRHRHGFTLVELSVVLVIIGLLIGGILAAQEMIHAGKLSRVTTDAQRYKVARIAFEAKYASPPGDFDKATSYWGTAATGTCPSATGTGTCNGNGDGHIGLIDGTSTICEETHRAWQHLVLSGFMTGTFTGVHMGATNYCAAAAGVNAPPSPIGKGALFQWVSSPTGDGCYFFKECSANVLLMGGSASNTDLAYHGVITPGEAASIDAKSDDGQPASGSVQGLQDTACITAAASATAKYQPNDNGPTCALGFYP